MSEQIHVQRPPTLGRLPNNHEDNIRKEIESERTRTPEISISSAVEIDAYTGLPKLPVELPPPSPDIERRTLNLQGQGQDQFKVLASALKMSTVNAVAPITAGAEGPRKSVTFHESAESTKSKEKVPKEKVGVCSFRLIMKGRW